MYCCTVFRLWRLWIIFNILVATAPAFAAASAPVQTDRLIAPGKIHEACMKLAPGARLTYSFNTDTPLNFNIHYHRGNDVIFPVKQDAVKSGADVFEAKTREDYCMMWSNPSGQPVTVFYRHSVE